MSVVVCAGGCGCRIASKLSTVDKIVCVGSPMDLSYAPDDANKVTVKAGSSTGAHRDHIRAFRQLQSGENSKKLEQLVRSIKRATATVAPVIAFGLAGAVGLATARYLIDKLGTGILVTVLPHPDEPEAEVARAKWAWLRGSRKFRNCVVAAIKHQSSAPFGVEELISAAKMCEKMVETPLDVVVNWARTDQHFLGDKRAKLEDITRLIASIEKFSKGSVHVREISSERDEVNVDMALPADDEDDGLDPWSLL